MGYYMSGGYYRAGGYYGRGGFFSKVGKALGGAAKTFAPQLGALAGGALGGPAGAMIGGALAKTLVPAAKTASPGAGAAGIVGPSIDFLRGFPASSKTGTPTNVLGDVSKALGFPFVAQENLLAGTGGAITVAADGTIRRRYRRMNMLNPRALRRSMRRVQGFAKFARKTISFTQRVKMKKRGRR